MTLFLTSREQPSPKWKQADADARADLLAHYQRRLGRWRFNEVVGYLRLSISHRNVQGAYFGRLVRETGPRYDEPVVREVRTRTKVFRSIRQLVAASTYSLWLHKHPMPGHRRRLRHCLPQSIAATAF